MEKELNLSGVCDFPKMFQSRMRDAEDVNKVRQSNSGDKEDVKCLTDYLVMVPSGGGMISQKTRIWRRLRIFFCEFAYTAARESKRHLTRANTRNQLYKKFANYLKR